MKKLSIFSLSLFMLLAACKKDNSKTTALPTTPSIPSNPSNPSNPVTYNSLKEVFDAIKPKATMVTMTAEAGGSFYSDNGIRFIVSPYAFRTMDNKPVKGMVNIEVRECLKGSDMILNRMLSLSNGKPLISAGSAYIRATQGGKDIKVGSSLSYEVRFPTNRGTATADMLFFKGEASTSIPGSDVNWNLFNDSLNRIVYEGDTITLFPDSTGYINLDKFTPSEITAVNVKVDGIGGLIDIKDFSAYYKLDGMLSIVSLDNSTYSANEFKGVSMLKQKAHIIVCCVYKGGFYAGTLMNITPVSAATYTVSLSKMTPVAFKTMIDALP